MAHLAADYVKLTGIAIALIELNKWPARRNGVPARPAADT